ncbi:Rieske (2Fe-2S) domain protein [Methylobacterium sp. 4-46]|uniref:aromatic ring-hydroxylating oxygenase subunit alpha n=1 Tax=unclassified Methylobacterium TaxID=2615210 RepID=UPI000165CD2D|nr:MULTISPECIES: aromatic ring-hydroxylating dioxygenase subunit alpha [Methylobacterium]ACA20087.1 Rieske (2Fe-2S) domain protein [Methylobacterium sp. 4-46]WFT79273.1 aromatic ring-hydroxylating dioxygenase subunit alpha [Methylobacterium nodulans]
MGPGPDPQDSMTGDPIRRPLDDVWYCVGESRRFREGRLCAVTLGEEAIVVGRAAGGGLFALRDRCPHRGMALSAGRLVEGRLVCPFHGWEFRPDGQCAAIPALAARDESDFRTVRLPRFSVREASGLVWIAAGEPRPDAPPIPEVEFPYAGMLVETLEVEASFDLVALSFVDPAHVAYVHDLWWWRTSKTLREKEKHFAPSPFGFTMTSHRAKSASAVYRLLGAVPEVEIEFRLPGVRLERIRAGEKRIANYTFATPLGPGRTALVNAMYWNLPLLNLLRPLARPLMRQFLGQDRDVLQVAQKGLDRKPAMVLIGESDVQSQWYFSLKREFLRAREAGAAFANPLAPRLLRWRS